MTIDKLAEMTQQQFSHVDEQLTEVKDDLQALKAGQERILEVLLEIPSKKAFERQEVKVNQIDARLTVVEKTVGH